MVTLLEFLFQGFFEWVYSLILDIWNFFASSLLNVMTLDFAYIKTHIPIVIEISQVLVAVGWALLLGNLVFQALRGMVSGLGFEGEDPKLLFARTFVFSFLLLVSPEICETVLTITSDVITLLSIPDAIDVHLVDSSAFGVLGASWLLVIIFNVITMFMVLSLLLEVAERYMVLAMLTVTAPLAFAMGGSKSTSEIFTGWCRMFGSMCLLMATNIIFFKMLLSVVATVPSFPDVFLWMVLIVSIVKVAKKADEIITRIGLNPAITGNRSTLPGMLAYTVFRTAMTVATKGAVNGIGGALGIAAGAGNGAARGASGAGFKGTGRKSRAAAGAAGGTARQADSQQSERPRYGGGRQQNRQTDTQQEHMRQSQQTQQSNTSASQSQTSGQQSATMQECTTASRTTEQHKTNRTDSSSRRTSVPQGVRRAPGHVAPPSVQSRTEQKNSSASTTGKDGIGKQTEAVSHNSTTRSAQTVSQKGITKETAPQSGTAGTQPRSTQRPPVTEPQHGRNGTPTAPKPSTGAQRSGPAQQESRRTVEKASSSTERSTPTVKPGTAGTQTYSTQRPTVTEPRQGRNRASTTPPPSTRAQRSSLVQQESQRTVEKTSPSTSRSTPTAQPTAQTSQPGAPSGTAGTLTHSTRRPPVSEPRVSRNGPPVSSTPTIGAQSSSPVQQKSHRAVEKVPPSNRSITTQSAVRPGTPPGTTETQSRSTQRPAVSEPRHSRNGPPVTSTPSSTTQRSSPIQQEPRQSVGKDKPAVKGGAPIPHPGTAGTGASPRTPPGQKLSGGPSKQKPTRQTNRKGGPASV